MKANVIKMVTSGLRGSDIHTRSCADHLQLAVQKYPPRPPRRLGTGLRWECSCLQQHSPAQGCVPWPPEGYPHHTNEQQHAHNPVRSKETHWKNKAADQIGRAHV